MTRRVLLVDDDDDIRTVATISLQRVGGWTVTAVDSGEAAVAALRAEGPFDAVLLDVMMPGLDGPATLERLRASALPPDVPVVFLTAKVQASDRERLLGLGAAAVLAKPFDPMTLPGQLDAVVAAAGSA